MGRTWQIKGGPLPPPHPRRLVDPVSARRRYIVVALIDHPNQVGLNLAGIDPEFCGSRRFQPFITSRV